MRRFLSLLLLIAATLALAGCAKQAPMYAESSYDAPPPPPPPAPMDYDGAPTVDFARSTSATSASKTKGGRSYQTTTTASTPAQPARVSREQGSAYEPEATEPAPAEEPAARMVHYNGYAKLQATKTEELVQQVVSLATGMGGFVEQLGPSRVTVRVPVEQFEAAMARVLGLADVLDRSISADDVTDAFLSVDLRLTTARTTRDRLVALLAQAKDENEKLRILAQIRRLSEEIDVMEGQLRTLSSLASMSRITVEVVARPAFASQAPGQDPKGFSWIHQLSPFRRDVAVSGELSKMEVPTGFVALDIKKRFIAESADGAVIWTTKLDNEPQGDAAFWVSAIQQRLSPEFRESQVLTLGAYQVIRFVSETDDPYRYLVGVRVDGDELYLVEVYFPNDGTEDRYKDAVHKVIAGGKS